MVVPVFVEARTLRASLLTSVVRLQYLRPLIAHLAVRAYAADYDEDD